MNVLGMVPNILLLQAALAAVCGTSSEIGEHVRRASSAASNSAALTNFAALELTGQKTRFGLSGSYLEVDDLRSGRFRWHADYGVSRADEGLDAGGRWRMDASRRLHPLDSLEAKAVAITESYLAKHAYLNDESFRRASMEASFDGRAGRYDVVAITPPGGRTARLRIDRTDHLVRQVDIRLAERIKTIRYSDYREVGGAALPFAISVDDGDEPDTGRIAVSSYRLMRNVRQTAFARPPENLSDTRLAIGRLARVSLRADSTTAGFAVVLASVNGREPLPFILDTGGHDIVTPETARRFGLKVVGAGATFGAGAGSTKTAFTRLRSVSLGSAEMLHQPFVVLDQDLGFDVDAHHHKVPIAGILGLELFERFTVTLDFKNHYVELRPRFAKLERRVTILSIAFTSDEPLVHARVDGTSGSFAIDTGNNVGIIVYRRWIVASGVPDVHDTEDAMGGSSVGGAVSFRRGRIRSLALGTRDLADVPVLISDARTGSMSSRSEAGNIGVPTFAGLRVTFQYVAGKMMLGL